MTINPPDLHATPQTASKTEEEFCRSYLDYQRRHPKVPLENGVWPAPGPAVTISTQTGAGASEVARHLAVILQDREPAGTAPWTVFNRQMLPLVLEEHHLPKRLSTVITEDRRSYFQDVIDQFMGLRPPSWEMVPKIIRSVQHLADMGHVILVGRGAGFMTPKMARLFQVRLVASMERRIERVQRRESLSAQAAAKLIITTERRLARYLRAHFHANIEDDLQYDLVINTDRIPAQDAAELIADGAGRGFTSMHEEQWSAEA